MAPVFLSLGAFDCTLWPVWCFLLEKIHEGREGGAQDRGLPRTSREHVRIRRPAPAPAPLRGWTRSRPPSPRPEGCVCVGVCVCVCVCVCVWVCVFSRLRGVGVVPRDRCDASPADGSRRTCCDRNDGGAIPSSIQRLGSTSLCAGLPKRGNSWNVLPFGSPFHSPFRAPFRCYLFDHP